jgi:hypothetical protein
MDLKENEDVAAGEVIVHDTVQMKLSFILKAI